MNGLSLFLFLVVFKRTWSRAPRLGTQVFDISRAFIMFTVIIFAIISSYNMSSFPFDNACGK